MAQSQAQFGPGCLPVTRLALHGGARAQCIHRFRVTSGIPIEEQGVAVLQGGTPFHLYNTDMDLLFRQEAYFAYLFGVVDEDYYGALDLRSGRSFLFMPRLPPEYAVWMGHIPAPEEVRERYAVDEVRYVDELASVLEELAPPHLHVIQGTNTDSGLPFPRPSFPGVERFRVESAALFPVLAECRVVKTDEELVLMRHAAAAASAAHVAAMQACKPGLYEYQLESLYLHNIYSKGGCRRGAAWMARWSATPCLSRAPRSGLPRAARRRTAHYTPIFASGPNAAVLHYGHAGAPNDRRMADGDLLLVDAGAEFFRYAADITTTFPVNGRFTPAQRLVYEAVLGANRAVIAAMRPGVSWVDMHLLAERTILGALKEGGLLRGEVEEMVAARLGAVFMPHGLGHFLGLDTHDVGGYLPGYPPRPTEPGLNRLRTARVLEDRMVITVEPGCYFTRCLLEPAFADPVLGRFLVEEAVRPYMGMGGVRVEDDVLVTAAGAETLVDVPRTVEEVEAVMGGAPWPPPGRAAA